MSKKNTDPERASRPFDGMRDGIILSEGAGIVVIEEMDHAIKRGAHIYAEILGYATRSEWLVMRFEKNGSYGHENQARSLTNAMQKALKIAHIKPEEIDYVCANAPSNDFDTIETIAIKQTFDDHAYHLLISSIKSMTGEPLAAGGPLQLIASIMAIKKGIIPPTINYEYPDPDCDLDYVPNKARKCEGTKIALINSHGIYGNNSSMIIGRVVS